MRCAIPALFLQSKSESLSRTPDRETSSFLLPDLASGRPFCTLAESRTFAAAGDEMQRQQHHSHTHTSTTLCSQIDPFLVLTSLGRDMNARPSLANLLSVVQPCDRGTRSCICHPDHVMPASMPFSRSPSRGHQFHVNCSRQSTP